MNLLGQSTRASTPHTAHRRLAGAAADPLYTALARAGLHTLTDKDHQAVRELTRHLDPATLHQVSDWLECTRATVHSLTAGDGGGRAGCRPRSGLCTMLSRLMR
ncbi:hypothetical protein [Kitasatospora sp. NPDC004272]